jgi:hypothetical protein
LFLEETARMNVTLTFDLSESSSDETRLTKSLRQSPKTLSKRKPARMPTKAPIATKAPMAKNVLSMLDFGSSDDDDELD